jgi:hypothetical protein
MLPNSIDKWKLSIISAPIDGQIFHLCRFPLIAILNAKTWKAGRGFPQGGSAGMDVQASFVCPAGVCSHPAIFPWESASYSRNNQTLIAEFCKKKPLKDGRAIHLPGFRMKTPPSSGD